MSDCVTTELLLLEWRKGLTIAERLCAQILSVEGFLGIDPQSPLGGPDGIKDILCNKNGINYVAGVYFPTSQQSFQEIMKKFCQDIEGVERNSVDGFVFLTNQKITVGERTKLQQLGSKKTKYIEIYHLERIRVVLDSPKGYGIRLEYLGVELNKEEQLSFFHQIQAENIQRLQAQEEKMEEFNARMKYLDTTASILTDIINRKGILPDFSVQDIEAEQSSEDIHGPEVSSNLTINLLLLIHRAVTFEIVPTDICGKIRNVQVWILGANQEESEKYIPPPPKSILSELKRLIYWWNTNYSTLMEAGEEERIEAIASFHHGFLRIHPFVDGNGRVARFILNQHLIDLLEEPEMCNINKDDTYIKSLKEADNGNINPLKDMIKGLVN